MRSVRVSSVATQQLTEKAEKTVCADCPTRWSSTFTMLQRLLEVKTLLNEVFQHMNWDSLLASEWQ